jgi:hypothetical protein
VTGPRVYYGPVILLLSACGPTTVPDAPSDPEKAPVEDTAPETVEDEEERDTAVLSVEEAGTQDTSDLAASVFTQDVIHAVEITLDGDALAALNSSPYDWAPATVTYDGVEMPHVGVRLRGKIGSYRTLSGKPKFKISFNEYISDQRFYGLEELSLNNSVVDCTYMRETMGWKVFEAGGVPALRAAYAWVTVNGSPYGLYQVVETPNDRFLDRVFQNPDGNLYDGKYVWYGGYSYTLLDFGTGVDSLFQLEEGEDVGNADIAAVSAQHLAARGTADYYAAMDAVLDWDLFHRMFAVETFIGHLDGYSMNTNNYRVYFDPTDGKAHILSWDLDYSFYEDWQWGMSWRSPRAQITYWCLQDPTCFAAQMQHHDTFLDELDVPALLAEFDRLDALTYEYTQIDPRRECSAADVAGYRASLRWWIENRTATIRSWGI